MSKKWCPSCEEKGQRNELKFYYISFKDGVWLCSKDDCTYPLDRPSDEGMVTLPKDIGQASSEPGVDCLPHPQEYTREINASSIAHSTPRVSEGPQEYGVCVEKIASNLVCESNCTRDSSQGGKELKEQYNTEDINMSTNSDSHIDELLDMLKSSSSAW